MMKNKDKDPICCIYSTSKNKCWRHLLKDVNFEDLNDVKFEDIEVSEDSRTSTWYNWLKSEYTTLECQITNLRLCWNSHQHEMETWRLIYKWLTENCLKKVVLWNLFVFFFPLLITVISNYGSVDTLFIGTQYIFNLIEYNPWESVMLTMVAS